MLYQKGTQRIEVIVRKEGGASVAGAKQTEIDEGAGGTTWRTAVFGSESPKRIKRVIKTNATHSLAVSKQIAGLSIEYYLSGMGQRNGDEALQDNVQRTVERVEDVGNIASATAMGALYGSWGGPIGAVLGATFGLVQSGVSTALKYQKRDRDFDYKMFKLNNGIEYQRARANINLTTGRLR